MFYTQCCRQPAEWRDNYCGRCRRALKPGIHQPMIASKVEAEVGEGFTVLLKGGPLDGRMVQISGPHICRLAVPDCEAGGMAYFEPDGTTAFERGVGEIPVWRLCTPQVAQVP